MSKLVPCMWFNGDAEEAAKFYVSLVPNSEITHVQRNVSDGPSGKTGSVLVVEFTVAGQPLVALNGGMKMEYTHAISLMIHCDAGPGRQRLECVPGPWRQGRAVRLAQGSLGRGLAGRAEGYVRIPLEPRQGGCRTRDAGHDEDGQAGRGDLAPRVRRQVGGVSR